MLQGRGQLEIWLGEVSFPPACIGVAHEILPRASRQAGPRAAPASRLPKATAPPLAQRPSQDEGFGVGSAGHRWQAAHHGGTSPPLPHCQDSVLFLSGARPLGHGRAGLDSPAGRQDQEELMHWQLSLKQNP